MCWATPSRCSGQPLLFYRGRYAATDPGPPEVAGILIADRDHEGSMHL
jgi:hypothetical protein